MKNESLQIKNVVCNRCIATVKEILQRHNIPFVRISLGEAVLNRELKDLELHNLQRDFRAVGFEILQEKNERIINNIKSIIISQVYENELRDEKLSRVLSDRLHYDYSHLTNLFTKYEGRSISSFQNSIRVQRVKELLEYDELNISEIADQTGYSSAAYLSSSFRKSTGLSPSEYRLKRVKRQNTLDSL
ncbi:helix-turn-helix domain-containing protein [Zunongwangia sp. F363]|uniref:Helix-turn-helix domain-containing protein n=1 Tax=Autumnicola tepida TaxID=3075595 RepID=A0ABU3CBD4_9FLAO|nr:helix-turn-helix domain-containing protein [Zunongwangia sp. F363]MDT0643644.1 helix-turn-helix domain-containing protein [Zunongwangia sp. F363]